MKEVETQKYRRAMASDAENLTALMRRAKAHWGYPEEWMQAWQQELTMTPEWINNNTVVLLIVNHNVIGFYGLEFQTNVAYLNHLWIEPHFIGVGFGKALFLNACQNVGDANYSIVELNADPNAEDFYLHLGAIRVGEVYGEVLGTPRVLPKLQVILSNINEKRA